MSLAAELQNLERQRERELTVLRARITTLGDTLEHEASPAEWIREHPYVATLGAGVIGFVAAQLPAKSSSAAAPPAPAPAPPAHYADFLALLVNLAERFLQHDSESAPASPASPASLTVANAGSIAGSAFPEFLRPIDGCPPT